MGLSVRESIEHAYLLQVREKKLLISEACERLGIHRATAYRKLRRLREFGPAGFAHQLRGRRGNRRHCEDLKHEIVALYRTEFQAHGFGVFHFYQTAKARFSKQVSYPTVFRWLKAAALCSDKRRPVRHRSRRPRKEAFGEMLQMDTSIHDWLSTGTKICLVAAIDDATNHIVGALFSEKDTTLANMAVLKSALTTYGIPASLYTDRSPIFKVTRTGVGRVFRPTYEAPYITQMQRALDQLGIDHIVAYTPQAKGRVERLFGTLQNRLVCELSKEGIKTIGDANQYLWRTFLPAFHQAYAQPTEQYPSSFVPLRDVTLDRILSERYPLTVPNDHVVSSKKAQFFAKVLPSKTRMSYAKTKVDLYKHTDGRFELIYDNQPLAFEVLQS